MDQPLPSSVIKNKKRTLTGIIVLIATLLVLAVISLRFVLKPSIKSSEITTAVVVQGDIENTLPASGEMLPEFELVITSPIISAVKDVMLDAGTTVKEGQSILVLDKAAAESELEKQRFELQSKKNNLRKLKLQLEKSFYDIRSNQNIKELRITSYAASLEDAKRLFKAGGGTKEDIEQAELNLKVAQLEKQQIENEIKNKQQTMQVEIRESELLVAIQEEALRELQRKIQLANVVAPRSGVITWVNKNIGSSIQEGEVLVKIANLESFKIAGSISDAYINDVKIGMDIIVLINDRPFRGTIVSINPSVQNSLLSFEARLDEKKNEHYRSNMKVDLFLVTDRRDNILKVPNGPAFSGSSVQDVFVLKNGKAERRKVEIGLSNFDFVELKTNIRNGEAVITSDMSEYKNANEITITN